MREMHTNIPFTKTMKGIDQYNMRSTRSIE